MGKINVLTSQVADMIAAGEVVQRPFSVVKELVENSIDAAATLITVEIKNGGATFIRVADNGSGLYKDDAKVAFSRHATSKIKAAQDLEKIHTLGFRGEALSSIAAVSKIELITKSNEEQSGTKVIIEAGNIIESNDIGCPNGTTIIVRNLFFNTPARMKFLKKDQTEAGYISEVMDGLILSHPEISMKLINNGNETIYSAGDNNLLGCVYAVYGKEYAKQMIAVSKNIEGIVVSGLTSNNTVSRANRSFQNFFVNGRLVKSRMLSAAIDEAYSEKLMKGRYPACVLSIEINPALVDVNVHPAKTEVKFADDKKIFSAVYWAVKDAIYAGEAVFIVEEAPKNPFKYSNNSSFGAAYSQNTWNKAQNFSTNKIEEKRQVNNTFPQNNYDEKISIKETQNIDYNIEKEPEEKAEQANIDKKIRIIGQMFDTYIILEQGKNMLLIDQHAAHERLKYEKLRASYLDGKPYAQILLSPVIITFSKSEMQILLENIDYFQKIGFNLEEFGNNSIIIRQTPISKDVETLKSLIIELLDIIKGSKNVSLTEIETKMLFQIACKSAIKANKKLSQIEMEKLVYDIMEIDNINTCPHGRPILISFSEYFIEKQFGRV